MGNPPIVVPPTTESPSYPHQSWHWLDQSHHYSHLDPLSQRPARQKSSPPGPRSKNKTSCPIASRPVPHWSLYDLRNQCSQFVCNCWFYPSLEDHFSRVLDPTQLENWLALNEARILCHVASRRHTLHTGQQHITEYFTLFTYHVRVHPFCTISLSIEKLVSRPRF
jgi:hypothetical protein